VLTNEQLATITLRHAIFHDVPNQRGGGGAQVTLATDVTPIDSDRRRLLKSKLIAILGSSKAYGIVFQAQPSSTVPGFVREITASNYSENRFIEASQAMARHLYQVQGGAVSPGLLCVLDMAMLNRHGLILMKLEREEGAELKIKEAGGRSLGDILIAVVPLLVLQPLHLTHSCLKPTRPLPCGAASRSSSPVRQGLFFRSLRVHRRYVFPCQSQMSL
jgi:hypothetical protein